MKFARLTVGLFLLQTIVVIPVLAADTAARCGLAALPDTISATLGDILPAADVPPTADQLDAAVDTLQKQGLKTASIIDYLFTAYCPAGASDTPDRKRSYARYIRDLVYAREGESETIVNVALKPQVMDAVRAKADDAGLSPEAWIAQMVTQATE